MMMQIKIEITDDRGGIEVSASACAETDAQLREVTGRVVRMLNQAVAELKSQREALTDVR